MSHLAYGALKKDSGGKHFTSSQITTILDPQLTLMCRDNLFSFTYPQINHGFAIARLTRLLPLALPGANSFPSQSRLEVMSPAIQIEVREGLVSCLQHHLLQSATFRHAE